MNSPKKDIPFDKFISLDILIGLIISAKNISKTNLLSFEVDIKNTIIKIVSKKDPSIDLENLLGKKVAVLCNIEPFEIEGNISHGILLRAKDRKGNTSFIFPENQNAEIGSKIH